MKKNFQLSQLDAYRSVRKFTVPPSRPFKNKKAYSRKSKFN